MAFGVYKGIVTSALYLSHVFRPNNIQKIANVNVQEREEKTKQSR